MTSNGNKISIIMPTYNSARYITEAIESALCQSYKDFEIIVVDDGSTDNTMEVIQPYEEKGLIDYIYQKNSGPATARNKGILNSKGEYITLLDADDILIPECLESVINFMEKYREVGFLFTNYDVFDEKGIVNRSAVDIWKIFRKIPHVEIVGGEWIFTERLTKHIIKHGSFMQNTGLTIRKDILKGIDLFAEGYFCGEDDEFYARVAYSCKSGYIDRLLARRRNHPESIIHDKNKQCRNILNMIELAEIQRDFFKEDTEIQNILNEKIPNLVFDYCWHLIEQGNFRDAQKMLLKYLKQYEKSWPLYKLFIKNYLYRACRFYKR